MAIRAGMDNGPEARAPSFLISLDPRLHGDNLRQERWMMKTGGGETESLPAGGYL